MSNGTDPSALAAEIEETRERLAGTIDELMYRTKPEDDRVPRGGQREGVLRRPAHR